MEFTPCRFVEMKASAMARRCPMLKQRLRTYKLSGMCQSVDERLSYAEKNHLSYGALLELLLEDEDQNRKTNNFKKRAQKSKLPTMKTLEDFDFSFQPSINKRSINDCATCQFISEKKNIVFVGNPGVGKTHLSLALGHRALAKGFSVLFTAVSDMLHALHTSKADNSYHQKMKLYTEPQLLILDELGFKKIPPYSADDFFEVISRRYEKGSIILTTNKMFEQWSEILGDQLLSQAITDRIVHYSTIFKIDGKSFRAKAIPKEGASR